MSDLIKENINPPWTDASDYLFKTNIFSEKTFINARASLAQTLKKSCDDFTQVEILKKMFSEYGFGMDLVIELKNNVKTWLYDSITFLTKNPCIVGFLIKDNNSWFSVNTHDKIMWKWQSLDENQNVIHKNDIMNELLKINGDVYLIWKMWIPLQKWITSKRPFYVRSPDTEKNTRWEYEPTSCFLPQKMQYKNKEKTIIKTMNKWSGPVLMSNKKEMVIAKPSSNGWVTENIMEFDGLPLETISDRFSNLAHEKISDFCKKYPHKKNDVITHVAHALLSICNKFGINVPHKTLTAFQLEESDEEKIREYDKVLENMDFEPDKTI